MHGKRPRWFSLRSRISAAAFPLNAPELALERPAQLVLRLGQVGRLAGAQLRVVLDEVAQVVAELLATDMERVKAALVAAAPTSASLEKRPQRSASRPGKATYSGCPPAWRPAPASRAAAPGAPPPPLRTAAAAAPAATTAPPGRAWVPQEPPEPSAAPPAHCRCLGRLMLRSAAAPPPPARSARRRLSRLSRRFAPPAPPAAACPHSQSCALARSAGETRQTRPGNRALASQHSSRAPYCTRPPTPAGT